MRGPGKNFRLLEFPFFTVCFFLFLELFPKRACRKLAASHATTASGEQIFVSFTNQYHIVRVHDILITNLNQLTISSQ
jgi:hypothetical protein